MSENSQKRTVAIVLSAGKGKRMQSQVHKQYLLVYDKPIIYYTLRAFEESDVDEIVLVTGADEVDYCRADIVEKYNFQKVTHIVAGGSERYDSVYRGLQSVADCAYVLIHDGARPMITPQLINENIACVKAKRACITAVPSKDTVKISGDDGCVAATPARANVWMVQTPQSFEYQLVLEAYQKREEADDQTVTDDAMVVEKYAGIPIHLLMGDYRNIKITTPEDLSLAEAFLA